ncbi:MAG: glycosyltransferase family 4 protein [Planctomycetes bacterium]|nr:glycosyltransferase family 4 protein [Planctomycetota bacterium]
MRIGIHPALKRFDGGIYQYTVTFLGALHALCVEGLDDEFVVFAHDPCDPALHRLDHPAWSIKPFLPPGVPPAPETFDGTPDPEVPRAQPVMRAWLERCGVDFMIYPAPHRLSFECGLPFVMAIHDLQHVLHPEFPEVSADGEWQRREYLFRNAARSATLLLAESETGREDILAAYGGYGVTAERVLVLPYLPTCTASLDVARKVHRRLKEQHDLPERYLYYPAQFWPHKNHLRLVEAIGRLHRKSGLSVPLVLTGSSTGRLREAVRREVERLAATLGIEPQVRHLGYVSDEEVAGLYAGATALVMPTFFGPTNLPFLDAWSLDCPVLTSRIRGIVEQVGDAAFLVDPRDVGDIAAGIGRLWTDAALRAELIARGRRKVDQYTPDDFRRRLAVVLGDAKVRVRSGARGLVEVG